MAATKFCNTDFQWTLYDILYLEYGFEDLNETSFLNLLDPFIRHNFIQTQSFCWGKHSQFKVKPMLTAVGFCYNFNESPNILNQET